MTGTDDLSWLRHRGPTGPGDLSWIRHRRLPATAPAASDAPVATATATRPATTGPAPTRPDPAQNRPATPPPAPARPPRPPSTPVATPRPVTPAPASTSLDLGGDGGTSLDLDGGPAAAPATRAPTPTPPGGTTSLDLSDNAGPTGGHPTGDSTSLDLSGSGGPTGGGPAGRDTSLDLGGGGDDTALDLSGPAPTRSAPAPLAPPPGPAPATPGPAQAGPAARPAFTPPQTLVGAPTVLSPRLPSVRLNRLQSGIGTLTFEAAWTPDEGFALGCAYQLRSGLSSVLRPGDTFGPLVMDRRGGHQRLRLDLLHGRHLERLIIFGVPTVDPGPHWAGTLIVTTHGHARIEVPVQPPPPDPTVLLSLYNVDGEIVLRAEAQTVPGRVRDACLAFGYERIAWRDADTAIAPT